MSTPDRAFVDRRPEDLVVADAAAHAAAQRWRLSAPVLVRHGMNAIYRCGDTALRVSTPNAPATLALELSAMLDDRGILVARAVRNEIHVVDELSVSAWEFIEPVDEPVDWARVGNVIAQVHELQVEDLPIGLPKPSPVSFPWWDFDALMAEVAEALDAEAAAGLATTIARWDGWRSFDDVVVCHGDVHTGNVMMSSRGPVVIDWDLLCIAPRGWDHAPLMTWHHPWDGEEWIYRDFSAGYGWSGYGDSSADAFAELRLVAATLMRLRAGMMDPTAMPEAQRRLGYWRGDHHAPRWCAT